MAMKNYSWPGGYSNSYSSSYNDSYYGSYYQSSPVNRGYTGSYYTRRRGFRRVSPRPAGYRYRRPARSFGFSSSTYIVLAAALLIIMALILFFAAGGRENPLSGNDGGTDYNTVVSIPTDGASDCEDSGDSLYYYYSALSNSDKKLYDALLEGVRAHEEKISLDASREQVDKAVLMLRADHPELFWVSGSYSTVYDDYSTDIMFNYTCGQSEASARMGEIERCTQEFISSIDPDESDYTKIKRSYEYLIDSVEYVAGSSDNQNLYSALVNHESVCAGYARAYQYILQRLGVQAIYVSGRAINSSGSGSHAWNIVRCGGSYYYVDVTFGDSFADDSAVHIYNYTYLCGDEQSFSVDHTPESELGVPDCCSDDLNYYSLVGRLSSEYGEQVTESMRSSIEDGESVWSYQFTNENAYRSCLRAIRDGAYGNLVWERDGGASVYHSSDDDSLTVWCWHF